jgi:hypothetical protein
MAFSRAVASSTHLSFRIRFSGEESAVPRSSSIAACSGLSAYQFQARALDFPECRIRSGLQAFERDQKRVGQKLRANSFFTLP